MQSLNYHHLLYFWTVVREGRISRAAEKLRVSQPTISAQLKLLEDALGERLFQRQGRTLVLTDVGRSSTATPRRSSPPAANCSRH